MSKCLLILQLVHLEKHQGKQRKVHGNLWCLHLIGQCGYPFIMFLFLNISDIALAVSIELNGVLKFMQPTPIAWDKHSLMLMLMRNQYSQICFACGVAPLTSVSLNWKIVINCKLTWRSLITVGSQNHHMVIPS